MNNRIYGTANYDIYVQDIYDADIEQYRPGYALINRATGVCEFTSFIYPEMLVWVSKLDDDLNEHMAEHALSDVTH